MKNRFEFIRSAGRNSYGRKMGIFKCSCGTIKRVNIYNVETNKSRSCGCLKSELASKMLKTHGKSDTPEYKTYRSIKNRCYNISGGDYYRYGGSGIVVCDRWLHSFESFLEDMGLRPTTKHSIDRVDNSKGYSPDNCRWATSFEQIKNRTVSILHHGELSSEASRRLGGTSSLVRDRLKLGWDINDAFNLPKGSRKPK